MGKSREAARRATERREYEDSAARLATELPRLSTLRLELEDGRGSVFGFVAHVRHVVVPTAPALFEFPCGDRMCKEGGHDLTREILGALRAGKQRIEGAHVCGGLVGLDGSIPCGRVLHYVGSATLRELTSATLHVVAAE